MTRHFDQDHQAQLKDIPCVLGRMAEFTASHAGTQTVIADTDGLVLEGIGEIVVSLCHGTDKNTDAFLRAEGLEVIANTHDRRLVTHGDFAAVGREMVGDGVLDDPEQLLLGICRTNRQPMKQLDHETGKTLEGAWNADRRVDLDQDTFGGMDVDLQFTGLVGG